MKRILATIFSVQLLFSSCTKERATIDAAVGSYSLIGSEYVTWGRDSGTLNVNARFTIIPTGGNEFKVMGYYNTTGKVQGSTLYFDSYRTSDSSGYMDIAISPAILVGNTINLTVTSSGKLAYNGILYPYTSRVTAVATKLSY